MYKQGDRVRVVDNEFNEKYFSIGNVGEVLFLSSGGLVAQVLFDSDANGNQEAWVVRVEDLENENE